MKTLKIEVEIQGIAPLLQNNIEAAAEQLAGGNRKRKTSIGGLEESWKEKLYHLPESENLGHPSAAIESALVKAGRDFKGDKRRSLADTIKALCMVEHPFISLLDENGKPKKDKDQVLRASVVNPSTKGRMFCYRPQFDTGWKGSFTLTLWDAEVLQVSQLKEVLDHAGFRIGIGDWRPKFGRFMVTKFQAN